MQTTGACLFASSRCSSPRVQTPAQDSRSAHGLLYPLLYGTTSASMNTVKAALTSALLHSRLRSPQGGGLLSCDVSGPAVCPLHPYTAGRGSAGLVGDPEAFTSRSTDALPIPGPDAATDAARR